MTGADRQGRLVAELRGGLQGDLREFDDMSDYTTLRVGGPARIVVQAAGDDDLQLVGRTCAAHGVPVTMVGRGSNLLVADDGFDGVVIVLGRQYRGVEILDAEDPGHRLVLAGAAEPMPTLAKVVAEAGLGALAWAAGVPGTVGGAVRMNAGAHGGEVRDTLVEVEVVRLAAAGRETWPREALGLTYRHSELPSDAVVVAAMFRLPQADPAAALLDVEQVRAWRREHQPINLPNCGSVFTNPPGDSAGRLIEAVGAKGLRIGGAKVSTLHANFIVTDRGCRADDVHALIVEVRRRVLEAHGVLLRPEVTLLGRFAGPGFAS